MSPFTNLETVSWLTSTLIPPFAATGVSYGFGAKGEATPERAQHLRQVHGTTIVDVCQPGTGLNVPPTQAGDGLQTEQQGVCVAIKTADCLPVLITDTHGQMVMVLHAGWRGLTAGILNHGLQVFRAKNFASAALLIGIGPAIGSASYEVGDEVVEALHGKGLGLSPEQIGYCLSKGQADRWHVDLQTAAVFALTNAGVPASSVAVIRICTKANSAWASFRRDGANAGRNISWITPAGAHTPR